MIGLFCPDDGKIWVAKTPKDYGTVLEHTESAEPPLGMSDVTEWIV